ncbi:Pet127-domain-containing protein [Punctularia strigosozonata HHB-11173 SS5]|uniref:Pet127-domain-containing protein n=1 Tax=Punctularia strigosozonata (strain HHB-11173) TaxID=741275 RepID=UPI000441762F|nr:Pet127-domain-containing protein [Punctularia strigosozonata HHB-11173 SS5]EIN12750.1 Pet127-domain-containing protein [Punctularia strigosozonata HHB-11173 SS5]
MEDAKSKLGTNEADSWTSGWGPDELAPPSNPQDPGIRPPHPRPKLPYTRRIEGLINPEQRAVLQDIEPPSDHKPIANLAHGLDRVLFNPGVHWLRDPRSRVYNFTPWLEEIPEVTEFAFERLTGFIRSSRDEDLWSLAKAHDKTFAGSTSSLTGLLSHIYFLISQDRDVDLRSLSTHFANEPANFTPGQRMPVSLVFHHKDGRYAIDSDETVKGSSEKNILTWMGTLLENFLTKSPEDFSKLLRSNHVAPEEVDDRREAYRYAKSSTFVMRSQLDCQDRRLPGTGVFDIKTRAALPIRLDIMNYEENSGYLIRTAQGRLESFEKEYYDLIRSAFLKYSFQVRIGNMDGAIVAFHNTARIFGFQYIPLEEMDERLFGASDRGDRIFDKCVSLLEVVAAEIVAQYPGQSIRCMVEKLDRNPEMNVWVQPADSTDENDIVQLDVTVKNYVDDQEVSGARAVEATDAEWTVHWAISKSSLSPAEIRANLNYAKDRQFRAWALPSGLSVEQMEERWNSMNFGGSSSEGSSPFDPRLFYRAPFQTRMLRQLAREGRNDTEAWQEAERGLPKIIWGKPDEVRPEELDGEEGSVQPAAEAEEQVDVEGLLGDDLLPATTVERADSIPPNEQSEDPADDREAFLDPSVVANLEHAASLHRPHLHPDALLEDVDSSAPSVSVDEVDNNSSGSVTPSTYESRAPTYDMHSLGTAPTLGMEADLIQAVNSHLASLRNESAAASPPAAESPSDEPITEARERLSAEDPTPGPTEENVDSRKSSSP